MTRYLYLTLATLAALVTGLLTADAAWAIFVVIPLLELAKYVEPEPEKGPR